MQDMKLPSGGGCRCPTGKRRRAVDRRSDDHKYPRSSSSSSSSSPSDRSMEPMMSEDTRKGPWTEQEDLQLVCYVRLFGERRWDFIAKVSGLNRTGKSCRLRWVNYLHPGLKRGRMSPQEQRLVLDLHSKWGNRWSRIARKLPGRTDNEIKNYWRTHMRKKAQEQKIRSSSLSPSSSSMSGVSPSLHGSPLSQTLAGLGDGDVNGYSMDQIWNEIATSEGFHEIPPSIPSPVWDIGSDSLWKLDDEEQKMLASIGVSNYQHGRESYCSY